jgi:hypothetical protein
MTGAVLLRSRRLQEPRLTTGWLPEPLLAFADGVTHDDAKTGITLGGPRSLSSSVHPGEIHVGFIGTAQAVNDAERWLGDLTKGVDGDESEVEECGDRKAATPFPGCDSSTAFRFALRCDVTDVGKITVSDMRAVRAGDTKRIRFESFLELLDIKLALLRDQDRPMSCVFVVLPDDVYKEFRVVEYRENRRVVHRDLHRAFKARAMAHGIPTQLLRHSTIQRPAHVDLDHPATIAWNLFTGLYFKAGGAPWSPVGLKPGTCAIGVTFFRPLGDDVNLRASVVQAFDENGDVFVLRGMPFRWDENSQGRQPHLSEDMSARLVTEVLNRYRAERHQSPRRVVVHKRSRFNPAEREGFRGALDGIETDLVALRRADEFRLLREGRYPVLRGTHYSIGDNSYLYTNGYLSTLRRFPHGHVPTPIEIADHQGGDTPSEQLLAEILLLTKMNWNSANYAESLPITLRFAGLVGDILREVPDGITPQKRYAFYM